ncbi:unnamed protein product, partial [Symbiodinium necroappetens]
MCLEQVRASRLFPVSCLPVRSFLYVETRQGSDRRRCCQGLLMCCGGFPAWVLTFVRSWNGRHIILLINAAVSSATCTYQYLRETNSPRHCLLALVAIIGLLSVGTGLVALASVRYQWRQLDRHFRWAILWKSAMLAGKVILLAIPKASTPVHFESVLSCGPDPLCPEDCLRHGGYCHMFQSAGHSSCKCVKSELNWTIYVLTSVTSCFLCMLTLIDLAAFWSARRTPWRESRLRWLRGFAALVGAAGINLTACLFALLVSVAPTSCYVKDVATAVSLVLPLVPLMLFANEARWIIATWKEDAAGCALIWSTSGLRVLAFLTCLAAVGSAASVASRPVARGICQGVHGAILGISCLTVPSAVACSLLRARSPPPSRAAQDAQQSGSEGSEMRSMALTAQKEARKAGVEGAYEFERPEQVQFKEPSRLFWPFSCAYDVFSIDRDLEVSSEGSGGKGAARDAMIWSVACGPDGWCESVGVTPSSWKNLRQIHLPKDGKPKRETDRAYGGRRGVGTYNAVASLLDGIHN